MTPALVLSLEQSIGRKYDILKTTMNERQRRLWAATEAREMGYGGISIVHRATGLAMDTIRQGEYDLHDVESSPRPQGTSDRIRRPGGGRKSLTEKDPTLLPDLDKLVDPVTRGDPESDLRWTSKSTEKLAAALRQQGHRISPDTVGHLLIAQKYSLQSNRKRFEGAQHPDRDAQFQHIADTVRDCHNRSQPVISVDTKKKELIGNYKNGGREWEKQGTPPEVNVYDFVNKELGKAIPYGVYDILRNEGWVSVGIDHDTAQFAAQSIKTWWERMGRERYPDATELLITADGGGSNGRRIKLWKVELQKLADELRMTVRVCHFPPGTSKWNRIEHRMFSFISKNWRGKPLLDRATVVNLIANTRTEKGLRIEAGLDTRAYRTKIKVTDAEMRTLRLHREEFHGEWNYRLEPREKL